MCMRLGAGDSDHHVIVKPQWEGATAEDVKQVMEEVSDAANSNNGLFWSSFLGTNSKEAMASASDYYKQYSELGWKGLLPELGVMKHELLQ